jgi:Dicarboxylate transport
VIRALAAVLLVALLLIAGLVGALLWFPGPLLRAGLRAAGIETVAFDDLQVGPTTLELTGLRIGAPPGNRLERLQIRYKLSDLVHGRIASIEAQGLELHGRIVDGRLELAGLEPGAGGEGGGLVLPAWPEEVVLQTAEVQLGTPWGMLRLPVSGALRPGRPEAEFKLSVAGGQLINDAGRLGADLDLHGHLPLDASVTLAAVSAQGHLDLTAEHFAFPGLAEAVDGRGELTFAVERGRIEARVGPAEVNVGSLAAELASLAEALPTPWQIRLGDRAGPIRITGPLALDDAAFAAAGGLDLVAGGSRIGADLEASLRTDAEGELEAGAAKATLNLAKIRWRGLDLTSGRVGLQAEGALERWQGSADLELAGGGSPTPAIALAGARLGQKLAVTFADQRLTLAASEPGRLAVDRLTWPDGGRAGPLAFQLEMGDPPLLVATFGPDGAIAWQQTLRAQGEAFDLITGVARGNARLADLSLAASGDRSGLKTAEVEIAGGRLQLPDQQITLDGIATRLALVADGLAPGQAIPVTVASISHGGKPAWFAPLTLAGTLQPNAGRVDFEARVSRPADALVLTLRGRQDLARGQGQAELKLAPLIFAPGGLQPGQLAPILGDRLKDVAGKIALDGTLAWGKGDQIAADLALLLDSLGFTAGPARLEQVNGVLRVDRLWPPRTPPGQQLAIGLLDLGLPLTEGLIGFRIDPDQTLAVEQLRWSLAGGTVRAEPFRVGSATSDIRVTLTADGLDLGQLFALTRLDGLSGDGRVHGTLPVRIEDGVAAIEGGALETDRPGWLRYRPAEPPTALQAGGANVNLLLQALENFHYEALRITLDGRTDAAMDIKLHVRGANPELYGGYPIEFNLNLEGELANILRSGLSTYQIPKRIREQMRGFQR